MKPFRYSSFFEKNLLDFFELKVKIFSYLAPMAFALDLLSKKSDLDFFEGGGKHEANKSPSE